MSASNPPEEPTSSVPRFLWEREHKGSRVPPGEVLAALRRGIGAVPGEVPQMWRYYSQLNAGGTISAVQWAEHLALTLYGVHQQGQAASMHWRGVRLGEALHALRHSGRFSESALDRRVAACATADDVAEAARHLRSLISMLKTLSAPQGLDYTRLVWVLRDWQDPTKVARVRRSIGSDYFRPAKTTSTATGKDSTP